MTLLKKRLTSIVEEEDQVKLEFADESIEYVEAVLAADGVHSTIRSTLYDEAGAEFTGHVAYRGLVSTENLGKDLMAPNFNIWTGPGAHIVCYYLRRGALLNYVAIVEDPDWQTESWTTKAGKQELVSRFEDWDPVVCEIIAQTQNDECYKWPCWSENRFHTGRVTGLPC
jgi:salicylate hydroxylase